MLNKHGMGIQATNVYASMNATDIPNMVDDIPKSLAEMENLAQTYKEPHTKNIKSAKIGTADNKKITISQGTEGASVEMITKVDSPVKQGVQVEADVPFELVGWKLSEKNYKTKIGEYLKLLDETQRNSFAPLEKLVQVSR